MFSKRRLVVGRFHRLDSSVGGKRVRLDAVERETPACHFYIGAMKGRSRTSWFGATMKPLTYQRTPATIK